MSQVLKIVRIARQARNEKGKKLFAIFREGENEIVFARMARWEVQLKGLAVLERHGRALKEELDYSSERQEVLADLMVRKKDMQKTAPEKYQENTIEEAKEMEDQRTNDALEIVQKKHKLIKWEGETEGKDLAKVGCDKSNRSVVRSSRQFLFLFVLILLGFRHRRSNVGFRKTLVED